MDVVSVPIATGTAETQLVVPVANTSQFRINYKLPPEISERVELETSFIPEVLYWFYDINHPQYRFNQPIILSVIKTNEYVLASDDRFNVYGTGRNLKEAFDEYLSMFIDYYQELNQSECELSEYLKDQLSKLKSILIPR
jgi:hypothetical protein